MGIDFAASNTPLNIDEFSQLDKLAQADSLFNALQGAFLHTILEWSAFVAAIFTVFLAFSHYRLTGDVTTPVIGVALFCAGCMDAFHTLAADRLIQAVAPNDDLIPFTWAVARIFHAGIMITGVAMLLFGRKTETATRGMSFVIAISILFGALGYIIILYCANSSNLPQTTYPDALITRPYDVIPLVLFLVSGLVIYPMFYRAFPSLFAHALVLSAVPEVIVELHMAFGSTALFDAHFNIAHFLKIFAYLVPFLGLCLDYIRTYEKVQQHSAALVKSDAELRDKTKELNSTIEELRKTNRYKSEFLANMSHELRTPLNSILGFSDILIRKTDIERPEREMNALKTVHRNGKHLLGLIDDILDLSKIDAGKMSVTKISLSTSSLLAGLKDQLMPLVKEKQLNISFELPDYEIVFTSDETKIMQILLNLGSNAVKYTEQGKITVIAEFLSDQILGPCLAITFRDTGIGIKEEDQAGLFSEFGRTDDAKSRGIKGTGLGLLITKRLVELLGGRIELSSSYGKGSEFKVYLPDAEQQDSIEEVLKRIDQSPETVVIMVVDDDVDSTHYFALSFEETGYKVIQLNDPLKTIELAEKIQPSIICLDLMMPKKNGIELTKELSANPILRDTPIVMVSVQSDLFQEALRAGAHSVLAKPCEQDIMVTHMQKILLEPLASALILLDEQDDITHLKRQLKQWSVRPFFAYNAASLLEKLDEFTPSLLILDLAPSDPNIDTLLDRLSSSNHASADIPTCISGYTGSELKRFAIEVDKDTILSGNLTAPVIHAITKMHYRHRRLEPINAAHLEDEQASTILIVEDTADNMELFKWILDSESYNHEGVMDGQTALDAVIKKQYELILMDINLPDISGTEVTRKIRQMQGYQDTPIIAVTAHAIKSEIDGILASGVTELVTKPIDLTALIAVIQRHMPNPSP